MRDVIYYVATSLDGHIAHPDGSYHGFPWDDHFGAELLRRYPETFPGHLRSDDQPNRRFDTVLMGRATYEVGLREGIVDPYPTLRQFVFSRSMVASPSERVTLIRHGAADRVRELKSEPGLAIWLCGGAALAASLVDEGVVDRVIVKLNPVLFGSGIPLIGGGGPIRLQLEEQHAFPSGHLLLEYRVLA